MQRVAKAPVGATGGFIDMGPAILVSGYLAKRTRSLGRWKKRWWQLTDDGTLLYFKNEERTRLLGEIDVARSCYEVKLGADQCKVNFPGAVPACCCFSFSVLKRTYYMYAATAADAKRWVESISSVSVVLNYKKKRRHAPDPPQRPASTPCIRPKDVPQSYDATAEEQRKAREKRSYSSPGPRLPKVHASLSGDVTYTPVGLAAEAADKPTELPRFAKQGRGKVNRAPGVAPPSSGKSRYGSAPNLFFGTGLNPPKGKRPPPPHNRQAANARLWLDGSPQPNFRAAAATRKTRRPPGPPQPAVAGHYAVTQHPRPHYGAGGGSLDRLQVKKQRTPAHAGQQQLITTRWPVDMDGYELPPRPQSVDVSAFTQPKKRTAVPPQRRLQIIPQLPATQPPKSMSSSLGDLTKLEPTSAVAPPPPLKPKPILKKSRAVQSPEITTELSTIPDAAGPGNKVVPPAIPPKHPRMKVSVNSDSGQRSVFLPPPPNFKPPLPPELRSDTSSLSVSSSNTTGSTIGVTRTTANSQNNGNSSGHWYNNPNIFIRPVKLHYLCLLKFHASKKCPTVFTLAIL